MRPFEHVRLCGRDVLLTRRLSSWFNEGWPVIEWRIGKVLAALRGAGDPRQLEKSRGNRSTGGRKNVLKTPLPTTW